MIQCGMEYYLYWWRDHNHTDPWTEGYVGITKDLDKRKSGHRHEHDWFREDLECVVLLEGLSEAEARYLERTYRPEVNIGWNKMSGGGMPPSALGKKFPGRKRPDIAILKPALGNKSRTGQKRSKEEIEKQKRFGKDNHFYGKKHKKESLVAMRDKLRIYHEDQYLEIDRLVESGMSQTKACKQVGVPRGSYHRRNKWL